MSKILLTGAQGQVGRELEEQLLLNNHQVISCSHHDLDITNEHEVASMFFNVDFDLVINSAAYTAVDKAEDEKDLAYAVNALGPKYLANGCKQKNIPLIHISTDYVYDNNVEDFHTELETPHTNCVYGNTKLYGEKYVQESGCNAVILRASWIFGRFGKNFVKAMLNLGKTRDTLSVVSDELGNPTPARALATDIVAIANQLLQGRTDAFGIYNYCGHEAISRDEFARVIFKEALKHKLLDHDVFVRSITSQEFGAKAVRPHDSRMSTKKFEETFNLACPKWIDYIEETLKA